MGGWGLLQLDFSLWALEVVVTYPLRKHNMRRAGRMSRCILGRWT